MKSDQKIIDLRSDTVTTPTEEMREAMRNANVGDDVYGEDPTVNRLESLAAQRLGKEAGLFVPSGTMGNQIALITHTSKGDEIILEEESHIYSLEAGGVASIAGLLTRTLHGEYGILDPQDIRRAIHFPNLHAPKTALICLENPTNRGGGTIYSPERLREIFELARESGVKVHMDGARIFNAAIAMGIPVENFSQWADTVMFCISKSLAAPIGSLLTGSQEWIDRARRIRKMLGGGMRQVGIIAAAGLVALERMVSRLKEDHDNAQFLAKGLASIDGIEIDLKQVQTNIVIFSVTHPKTDASMLTEKLRREKILVNQISVNSIRCLTHKDVVREELQQALLAIRRVMD